MENLLSLHVLAELKGGERTAQYERYQMGGIPDTEWEKSLRADWPGKKEALQRFVREWNRYPLKSIREEAGVALGFGVKHFCSVSFEGAPKEFYQITIEPARTAAGTSQDSFYFSSLPPWWKDAPRASAESPAPAPLIRREVNGETSDRRSIKMTFEELQRDEKTSTVMVKTVNGGSVGSAMFEVRGNWDIAKARGAAYFINLKSWQGENGEQMSLIGFAPDKNVDLKTYFDLKEPLPPDKRLLFLSVSAYERLFAGQP